MRSLAAAIFIFTLSVLYSQDRVVDFRYSPARHLNIICLPDDWLKTLVNERGELAYDFGPGPYARPLTTISIKGERRDLPVRRQSLVDAKIPIAATSFGNGSDVIVQRAFALIPLRREPILTPPAQAKVIRLGGVSGAPDWAAPEEGVDDAFRNVAWGTNRPILYRVNVRPGSRHRVALGLCESYKPRPRMRFLELRVEGAPSIVADPLADSVKNRPSVFLFDARDVNRDGMLAIEVHAAVTSPDPNVLLNALWVFPAGTPLDQDSVLRGRLNHRAEVYYSCGNEAEAYAQVPRIDGIIATFSDRKQQPQIQITSRRRLTFDLSTGILRHNGLPFVLSRPRPTDARKTGDGWILNLPEGTGRVELIVVHGCAGRDTIASVPDLEKEMQKASAFWLTERLGPQARLAVPDSGIQYVLDASIRTMYQVREYVNGRLQFQPGPTVYRGLWAGDIMLTGTPVTMLGDTSSMRQYLESVLRYQQPDGRIRVMVPHNMLSETPCIVSAMCMYASSSGNGHWLARHWSALRKGVIWIESTRQASLRNPALPYAGLMPPSFVDGGLMEPTADYGTAWWCMVALEKSIQAAERLGKSEDAKQWTGLYRDFWRSLLPAMRRDMRVGAQGLSFLPVGVGDTSKALVPQRGMYTFLFALRYGDFFHILDSTMINVVRSNMTLLDRSTRQGIVYGSGWMSNGVWPWLGGIHGIGHNVLGNYERAHDLLYAYANHATPLGTWVEEQQPKDVGTATAGDASDSEASGVFVQLVRDLLVVERKQSLAFLPGIPESWLKAGKNIVAENVLTEYGPVSIEVSVSPDDALLRIKVATPNPPGFRSPPALHLASVRRCGFVFPDGTTIPDITALKWGVTTELEFIRPGNR